MTTESLNNETREPFAEVGVFVLVGSIELGFWTSLKSGPGLFPFAMGAVFATLAILWLTRNCASPATLSKANTAARASS